MGQMVNQQQEKRAAPLQSSVVQWFAIKDPGCGYLVISFVYVDLCAMWPGLLGEYENVIYMFEYIAAFKRSMWQHISAPEEMVPERKETKREHECCVLIFKQCLSFIGRSRRSYNDNRHNKPYIFKTRL